MKNFKDKIIKKRKKTLKHCPAKNLAELIENILEYKDFCKEQLEKKDLFILDRLCHEFSIDICEFWLEVLK